MDKAENIIPDIFFKAKEGLHFDEAVSGAIDKNLTVGYSNDQMIIIDVLGRFVSNDKYPKFLSSINTQCKLF